MNNPFESAQGRYLVLVNDEEQRSLWPESIDVPSGWAVAFGAADRTTCLDHVNETWTDLRPRSLRRTLDSPLATLTLDHVVLFVESVQTAAQALARDYGLSILGRSRPSVPAGDPDSILVGHADIRLVLTEPGADNDEASAYLRSHGSGVADIAFRVADADAAFRAAVECGAEVVAEPHRQNGSVTATIRGQAGLRHTFVQHPAGVSQDPPPGIEPVADRIAADRTGVRAIDHFAVCVEPGQLGTAVEFYRTVLGFDVIFEERTVVGSQAMNSSVVQSASRSVTLTLIEPDITREAGQIDQFLASHRGPGVQHVAFTTDDIVAEVERMRSNGVEFLSVPDAYYDLLGERVETVGHDMDDLRRLHILVDEDHDGQLFQIFARSVHPRGTLFFELVERRGARTFGSGNIKALYAAMESGRNRSSLPTDAD